MVLFALALSGLTLGGLSPRAQAALSFSIDGTWDTEARKTAATNAMQAVVNRYNAYGNFTLNNDGVINVIYNASVGTADATNNGTIRFGGTYPAERVAQHETNHWLGSGTTSAWTSRFDGAGNWTGPKMNALAAQFDGDGAVIKQSGVHFYAYGLNFDSEVVNSSVLMRNIALTYAQRQDDGLGTQADPWSAATVALTQSDPAGASAFNWFGNWSDNYFAHPGAAYSTGNFLLRTPLDTYAPAAATPSFTFAGDSLTLNNTNGTAGGLQFKGVGSTSIVTFKNLILGGGLVRHASTVNDLFQLGGKVTVSSPSTIHADLGSINILANVTGSANLTIPTSGSSSYVRMLSPSNSFIGNITNLSRFELGTNANFQFKVGAPGVNNAIAGATAQSTLLNGVFQFDLTTASSTVGDSWTLVTAANATYGANFRVAGFDYRAGVWTNGGYEFNPANSTLTVVPPPTQWNANGGGSWSVAASWTGGVPATGKDVILGAVLTAPNAPATIDVDVPPTINRLTFDNANQYILAGANPLTLTGDAEIVAKNGAHRIGVPIAGTAGLKIAGAGSITLTAASTYSGVTTINAGTLALSDDGAIPNSSQINVKPGTTLNVSGLAGGFQLAAGQTLTNNSDNTVVGNVIAAAGSTVNGTGTFAGNVTAQAGATVRVGGNALGAAAPAVGKVSYVDATTGAGGNTTTASGATFNPKPEGTTGVDNDWERRTLGNSASVIESAGEAAEDAYEIKTTLTGLTPLEMYNVHAFFWDPTSTAEDWSVRAAYASNPGGNPLYAAADAVAELGGGAMAATLASTLTFRTAPLVAESGRAMLAAPLGPRRADENGKIEVFIDDLPAGIAANRRTWYDGLGVTPLSFVTMTVQGNYTLEAGATLVMDTLGAANHDQLVVTDAFTAAGTLQVVLNAGSPALIKGDSIDLFNFGSAAGGFDNFNLPALGTSLLWNVSNLLTTGELQVVANVDLDANGLITGDDFLLIQRTNPALIPEWRTLFGAQVVAGTAAVPATVPIPEPAALALATTAAILLARRRRHPRPT